MQIRYYLLHRRFHGVYAVKLCVFICRFGIPRFCPCKTHKNHWKLPVQPAHFLVFPNLLSLEQIAFLLILIGEKALDCTHIQRFPKPARTCNQRDFICIVPPLPDKIRLVNIEDVIVHHFLIILIS